MKALICGSMAFDTIMVFPDQFKNHILPDKVHMLNVSFMVPDMRREFGGCAGNIAYNLKLLGGNGVPMATVGKDFTTYADWFKNLGIDCGHLQVISGAYTAQAFITTDQDDNQITAFHPGAMSESHENRVGDARDVTIGIVSPDGRDGMIQHAAQFHEAGIPFIFDPGQGMPMYNGDDLMVFLEQCTWLTLNDYEAQLMQERTGLSPHEMAEHVEAVFITRGGKGSQIYTREHEIHVPAIKVEGTVDPTGCGDAYRAGLLYGLMGGHDFETCARIASLMGGIKVESHGTQNHRIDRAAFADRYQQNYGTPLQF